MCATMPVSGRGTTLRLNVCGDNPATSGVKEGYSPGENFLIRVLKDTVEQNVIACFLPKDTYGANDPNATGSFVPFGLSYIECLKTPPPPGTALGCSSPIPIACGETKTGNTSNGTSAAISYNCFFNLVDGPEVVYEFTNPITQNVLITLTGLQEDLEVLLLDACDRNSCIRFSDRTGKIPEALLANNLPAGTYFIIVDGYLGSDSPYTLHVTCGSNTTINGTLDCTGAIAAQCGQTITGNTNNGSDQIVQYGCSATYNSGKEKMYALTLTENKVVSARLFGLSADLNLIVLNACDPAACFASSSRSGTEDDAVLFYATAGKTYYFVVDGYFDAEGPYSLSFSCWDPCTNCPTDYDLNGSGQYQAPEPVSNWRRSCNAVFLFPATTAQATPLPITTPARIVIPMGKRSFTSLPSTKHRMLPSFYRACQPILTCICWMIAVSSTAMLQVTKRATPTKAWCCRPSPPGPITWWWMATTVPSAATRWW